MHLGTGSCADPTSNSNLTAVAGKVAFYANNPVIMSDVAIFRDVIMNHGNAYSATTGRFTAPLGGVYVFHLYYTMILTLNLNLRIQVNGGTVCSGYTDDREMGVCSAIVQLQHGDVVNVRKNLYRGSFFNGQDSSSGLSGFLYLPL